jgi:hypothetical protein
MTMTPKNETPTPTTSTAIGNGAPQSRTSARAATKADSVARARSIFQWMFRSRETGRITIMQRPNLALTMALIAIVVRTLLHPAGSAGLTLTVLVGVTLTVWAVLEVVRGVNPWRRLLGAVVLVLTVLSWFGAAPW